MSDLFADSVGQVAFSGGLVRMELLSIAGPEPSCVSPDGKVSQFKMARSGQVVMPLNGFIETLRSMQNLMDTLVAAGIVVGNRDRRATPPSAVATPAAEQPADATP